MTVMPQHMHALELANSTRIGLADFKRTIRNLPTVAAAEKVAHTIEHDHDDPVIGTVRVRHLMLCINRLGEGKVARCLTAAGVVNFDVRLRDLTPRQRTAVSTQIHLWSYGYGR